MIAALLAMACLQQEPILSKSEAAAKQVLEANGGSVAWVKENDHWMLSVDIQNKNRKLDFKILDGLSRLAALRVFGGDMREPSIAKLEKFEKLELLVLLTNELSETGFANVCKLKMLNKLDIKSTKIHRASLTALTKLPSLKRLYLYNTTIIDSDLEPLYALKNLSVLVLPMTVSKQGIANLRKRLPKTDVRQI